MGGAGAGTRECWEWHRQAGNGVGRRGGRWQVVRQKGRGGGRWRHGTGRNNNFSRTHSRLEENGSYAVVRPSEPVRPPVRLPSSFNQLASRWQAGIGSRETMSRRRARGHARAQRRYSRTRRHAPNEERAALFAIRLMLRAVAAARKARRAGGSFMPFARQRRQRRLSSRCAGVRQEGDVRNADIRAKCARAPAEYASVSARARRATRRRAARRQQRCPPKPLRETRR